MKPVSLDHQVPSAPPPGQVGLPSLPRVGCVQADLGCRQMALAPVPGRGGPLVVPALGELLELPGGGNGNPLQYAYLENPTDRGAWRATVQGVAKSQT